MFYVTIHGISFGFVMFGCFIDNIMNRENSLKESILAVIFFCSTVRKN